MTNDSLDKMEQIIDNAQHISDEKKTELHQLAHELRDELLELEKTEKQHAQSIAGFSQQATHESLREDQDEELLNISVKGMKSSVRKFEVTHPELTRVIQQICAAFGV